MAYAPEKIEYALDRFANGGETLVRCVNRHLSERQYLCGDEYTIADMANYAGTAR